MKDGEKRTIIIDEGPDFLKTTVPKRKIVPINTSSRAWNGGFR